MNHKFVVISFMFWVCYGSFYAQPGLDTISRVDFRFGLFSESAWLDSTIYIFGAMVDTPGRGVGNFSKYTKAGEFINILTFVDTTNTHGYGFYDSGFYFDHDTIVHIGSKEYGVGRVDGFLVRLDREGIILSYKDFKSFYYPSDSYCLVKDMVFWDDGYIIVDLNYSSPTNIQSCLLRLDRGLNQVWRYCYGNTSKERPERVFRLENGHFLVVSNSTDLDGEIYKGAGNAFHRGYIFEVDEGGQLVWEWRSSNPIEAAYAAILENDSTLIVAAGEGIEHCGSSHPSANCIFLWNCKVYKLDLRTREKIWETPMTFGEHGSMYDNRFYDIIPSIEGDGYILCGADYYHLTPDCAMIDTSDRCWRFPGIIAKISKEGDSLWTRKYEGIPNTVYSSNLLYDAEIIPDSSGYSFVGEAFNAWPGGPIGQYGWLVMTDPYGCLVPGCHLISSTEDPPLPEGHAPSFFKVHPNPATSMINVLITSTLPETARLYLFDASGREIGLWSHLEKGVTYIIPIDHLPKGMYILTMTDGVRVTGTEQIIVH